MTASVFQASAACQVIPSTSATSKGLECVVESLKHPREKACDWLQMDEAAKTGTFLRAPQPEEVPETLDMQTVVELYSR